MLVSPRIGTHLVATETGKSLRASGKGTRALLRLNNIIVCVVQLLNTTSGEPEL